MPPIPSCTGGQGVDQVLNYEDEENVVYSAPPPHNRVHSVLLVLVMEEAAYYMSSIIYRRTKSRSYAQLQGGVGDVFLFSASQ